ncbi:MAG TPA: hypothetical protein PKW80_08855 [Bacteroidales bacterium]|nr:hypothetical protein [Bacteroidales bacterium]
MNIPFFWDNVVTGEYLLHYFDTSFMDFIPPTVSDFGALTLNSYYLALFCALFGKSLLVCHLAMIPIVVGIFWETKNISLKCIRPSCLFLVYLFLLFDPAFITQTLLMGYDLFLLYFVLLAIRTLLEKKYSIYSISLLMLTTLSFRAMFFIFSLFIIHAFMVFFHEKSRLKITDVLVYVPAILFLIFWCVFHYIKTGWVIINPMNTVHLSTNDLQMVFRQLIYILWKITDSGRIVLWLFCIICFFIFYTKNIAENGLKKMSSFLIVPLAINSIIMIFLSNPIGHKYFLQTFVFLTIITVYFIQNIASGKMKILISTACLLLLFAGNFIVYPQKYGNAWETSLKVLPYFSLEKELKNYIIEKNINPENVYTYYPITNNYKYTYLQENFAFAHADNAEPDTCPYFIVSNIYNIKNPGEAEKVTKGWLLLKHFCKGQIYMTLWQNPSAGVHE